MNTNLLLAAAALVLGAPVQAAAQSAGAVAESPQPSSTVSVLVEPQLSDGRLVLKIAAKNSSSAPVQFGPLNVQISTPSGKQVGLYPLQALVNDVRLAAGMEPEQAPGGTPTAGAYAAPQLNVREGGQVDVTGYTGGAAVGQDELIRRSRRRQGNQAISREDAETQIAALNAAILKESVVAPSQIVAGQVVSQKLDFQDSDRTLHVRVRIAGDEHSFTIAAPRS